jgi:hypothetical protein
MNHMSKQNEQEWIEFPLLKLQYKKDLNMDYLITECCFDKTIIYTDQQPTGFQAWTEQITYDKCKANLPDGTVMDIKAYVNNQGTFDAGSYTQTLLHSYNGLFL